MNITNPAVVRNWNEQGRPMADLIEKVRRTGEQYLINIAPNEAAIAGNANGDVIVDGSETDGRSICAKQNFLELKYVVEQLVTCLNQDDRATLIANVSVNGVPLF